MGTLYPNTLAHVTEEGILLFLPLIYMVSKLNAQCILSDYNLSYQLLKEKVPFLFCLANIIKKQITGRHGFLPNPLYLTLNPDDRTLGILASMIRP